MCLCIVSPNLFLFKGGGSSIDKTNLGLGEFREKMRIRGTWEEVWTWEMMYGFGRGRVISPHATAEYFFNHII